MTGSADRPGAEPHAVRRYVLASALVLVLVVAATGVGAWWFARTEAQQQARDVAQMFARTVAAPLRVADLDTSDDGPSRTHLATATSGLLEGDDVYRVKVWRLDGDEVEIVYSDESEIDGLRVPVSETLAGAIRTERPVVVPVPQDAAHATELDAPYDLLEVYVPFRDADGVMAVAELYLITRVDERAAELLAHVLPLVVVGPVLLVAATLPLALRLARAHGQAERSRRELADRALAVSEAERRALARRLHDGLVQDLAAVGMMLELDGGGAAPPPALRAQLADRVRGEIARLRDVLDDLNPSAVEEGDLRPAFAALADRIGRTGVDVTVDGADLGDVTGPTRELVHRAGSELVRNALTHAGASTVRVTLLDEPGAPDDPGRRVGLAVRDDGTGFDPAVVPEGHHGLRLVRASVARADGRFELTSGTGGTSVRILLPRPGKT